MQLADKIDGYFVVLLAHEACWARADLSIFGTTPRVQRTPYRVRGFAPPFLSRLKCVGSDAVDMKALVPKDDLFVLR